MKIHEVSIRRPVAILMTVFIVLVLGAVSFSKIPIDLLPNIDLPIAIVSTSYSGVGPKEIESIVTQNIENAVATVSNIKTISSNSSEGNSIVIAEFNSGTDMEYATLQMREKIDMVKRFLPAEVENPMVMKIDPNMLPVVSLGVSDGLDEVELKRFVDEKIKPRVERLNGVASVAVSGGKTREIQIDVEPQKMAGYNITFNQIISALQSENLNQPGGTVEFGDKSLLVRTVGEFKSIEDILNIPLILPTGNIIYIRDVGKVKDNYKETNSYTRMDGQNSIGITVQKQSTANTVKVVNAVKKEIENIKKEYPNIKINLVFDQGQFIEQSIKSVSSSAVMGGILAIFILIVFLKNIRTTLIIGTSIPISIIATFVLIYFSGISLNMVSLGGLALGVGMLVDNAIVVLENIYRYRLEGHDRIKAAMLGTQEVGASVMASTLTTVAVFLPIVFVEGVTAQIFKELALTVTFSLLASLVVALTLIPMLSSKLLKVEEVYEDKDKNKLHKLLSKWDELLDAIDNYYRKVLMWVLEHRKKTILTVGIIFILGITSIAFVGTEYFPTMDQGQFTVNIKLPEGALLNETNAVTERVEKILSEIPELEKVFVNVGTSGNVGLSINGNNNNTASIDGTLKSIKNRKRSTSEIVDEIRGKVGLIPGADIKINEVSSSMMGGAGGSSAIDIKVSGRDLEELVIIAKEVEENIKGVEGIRQVKNSLSSGRPEAQIYVNRNKAAYYGLGTYQVSSALRIAVEGRVSTRYKVDGKEIDVRVQLPKEDRNSYDTLKNTKITTPMGTEVTLSDIAEVKIEQGPTVIRREGQERYVSVTADVFGRDVGSVSKDVENKIKTIAPTSGYTIEMGGQQKEIVEAFGSLALALLLSVLLVYMVMAAQFESLLHPFTIMFSVPIAYSGSAFALFISRRALSVPAFIGVIMLAGIVVNNAIVLVDYINILRKEGMGMKVAILKAGPTRLRPILMTTLTTLLGLLPLALGIGEGAELQAPLATVVIGGLLTSTILTLVIVPVIYTLFDDISVKIKNKFLNKKTQKTSLDI